MEFFEVVIWVLAVAGVVLVNLYKQWRQNTEARRRQRQQRAEQVATPLPPAPHEPAHEPAHEDGRGRFEEAGWGRAPRREEPMSLERLLEQARARQDVEHAGEQAAEEAVETSHVEEARPTSLPVREAPVYTTAASALSRRTPAMAPPRVASRRRRHRPLFNPHTDLRAAVIGMTVLGPCRALAPYEPPDSPGR